MKIQNLAMIFVIIILPISIILGAYTGNQIELISKQKSYDTKLTNSTYDALKAFQMNTINSDSSELLNSKLRDIQASINIFFKSIATNFGMSGYDVAAIQKYVPAIVYTMYDGYYIYSPYTNVIDSTAIEDEATDTVNGEEKIGLKPYIYYSCHYKKTGAFDVVINYTLDNYITIQGTVGGKIVNESGYLLSDVQKTGNSVQYNGITIATENVLKEHVITQEDEANETALLNQEYEYYQENNVKYYKDTTKGNVFRILNGKRYIQPQDTYDSFPTTETSGQDYYKEAADFKEKFQGTGILRELANLTPADAVDEKGNKITDFENDNNPIFNFGQNNIKIEEENSSFNQHRLAIIRYSIESNLKVAIANFNQTSSLTSTNFQMPILKDDEWEKIINNVSIISFLQGVNMGGKNYNGYSIVTNNKTKEVVSLESIYIQTGSTYHRITDNNLKTENLTSAIGRFNMDFEKRSIVLDEDNSTRYFMPVNSLACYDCIVLSNKSNQTDDIYQYIRKDLVSGITSTTNTKELAKKYYTALGRERQKIYHPTS